MHKVFFNRIEIDFSLTPRSPLLVKTGGESVNPALPEMQFVRTSVGQRETIYIPGSSLKGVFASFGERILSSFKGEGPEGACNRIETPNPCLKKMEAIEAKEERELKSFEVYRLCCRACRLFGNTRLKGRVYFSDAYPQGEVKTETRYGVAISRITQAVVPGALFEIEAVISGEFCSKVILENFEAWQVGLIASAFQALNDGILGVGFGKNRGFGKVEPEVKEFIFTFPKKHNISQKIWGIGKFVNDEWREKYGLMPDDEFAIPVQPQKEEKEIFYTSQSFPGQAWKDIAEASMRYLEEVLSR